ncbi:Uracil DNA glycosylase superfamily protein [Pelotomaculum schinkii]|uniref:Type-4 uracil-DNA glycosylase n=1 Tax=Pelotomaculum schinkii TaxID=78350 RepID=A0A4Y7RED6_9FIRM|nr:uracil-DNA glycosylase [Pelotomaculum schinkii]TEB07143.1 Uracil DNA glycosylase superfamily protein [Pelotomaculum schinkii]
MTGRTVSLETITDMETLKNLCLRIFLPAPGENIVFGEGPEPARLALIGEAPGKEEAKTGRPFVGNAGRLLNKYLEEAGIAREDVYITNVLKVRPPGNRTPGKAEIKESLPFLLRQIELIHPAVIVCLGSIAVQAILEPKAKITQIRGEWREKDGTKVIPTYHPAAIFHDEEKKELFKKDLLQVGKVLRGLE